MNIKNTLINMLHDYKNRGVAISKIVLDQARDLGIEINVNDTGIDIHGKPSTTQKPDEYTYIINSIKT